MPTKKTKEDFINEAISIHEDKYGYDLVNYVNNSTPVDIWCNKCSKSFSRTPIPFLSKKIGCSVCNHKRNNVKITKEVFLERANKIHNSNFTYLELDFNSVRDKIKWKCNTCGNINRQFVESHLRGSGCSVCYNKGRLKSNLLSVVTPQVVNKNDLSFHINSIYYHLKQIENLQK